MTDATKCSILREDEQTFPQNLSFGSSLMLSPGLAAGRKNLSGDTKAAEVTLMIPFVATEDFLTRLPSRRSCREKSMRRKRMDGREEEPVSIFVSHRRRLLFSFFIFDFVSYYSTFTDFFGAAGAKITGPEVEPALERLFPARKCGRLAACPA